MNLRKNKNFLPPSQSVLEPSECHLFEVAFFMVKMQKISRKYSNSIRECLNKRELQGIQMETSTPLKKRSQSGIIEFIQSKECQWLACTFRVNPTNRTLHPNVDSKKHIFQTIKWTVGFMKNEFNEGKNLLFLPFWGGEFNTGVATHVHALLEKPSQLTEDFYKKTQDKMNTLAQRAFKSSAKTALFIKEISNSNFELQAFGNYCMRWEGKQFGAGTDKLITELAYLQN